MDNQLTFETIFFDRQPILGARAQFFLDEHHHALSVRDLTEDQITNWLLDHHAQRDFFIAQYFGSPAGIIDLRRLRKPFTPDRGKPGDIDMVLLDPAKANHAIAFECKRIKIEARSDYSSRVNGAKHINDGIIQANKYLEIGFSQVYLAIFMLHDGRAMDSKNVFYRIGHGSGVDRIYNIPWAGGLREEVGVMFIEVYENTDKEINHRFGMGLCHSKRARVREQRTLTTENLLSELRKRADVA